VGQAGDPLDNISVGRLPNRRLQVREHSLALTRLTLKVTSRPRAPSRRWTAQLLCQSEPEPILSARRFVTSQSASVVRDTARADVAKAVSLSVGPQRSNPQMKALILRRLRSQPSSDRRAPKAASHRTIRRATGDSGRPLHDGALTDAHKTVPFGSRVRVTNHANGRSMVVTTLTPLHPLETSRSESEDSSTLTFEGASVRDTKTVMRSPSRLKADGMASR
jgi:hypothetical protein